ncbi:MAG TPA: EamA family transporter, partial [Telluria sp.]|nr:EamA family transporter [Telluria sp.]
MPDTPARSASSWLSPIPVFFVFLWSTGFIAAKYGLPFSPPMTFLILRCTIAVLALMPLVLIARAPWPRAWGHLAVAGLLLQGGYLVGVWSAIKLGMPAGLSALIVGMQPILTAFAAPLIGERVRPRQWIGLVLGLAGVALVVQSKISV